jgi:pimeloyl-ACP methyl ester carboxylesterase
LGTGVASQLAARRPLARLVLVTPFDSLRATAQAHYPAFPIRWLLKDRYDSVMALHGFRGPLLIVHAGRDDVVPEANTQALIASLPVRPTVVRIATADHGDIAGHPEFGPALAAFLHRP